MKFHLFGEINYDVGSCHDSRCVKISEEFTTTNRKKAVEKAKAIIVPLHERYRGMTDYSLHAELRVVKHFWETRFVDDQPARPEVPAKPAVPAQPARPAVEAHLEEKPLFTKRKTNS